MNAQKIARLATVWCLLLLPVRASAQVGGGAITGVVKDASGAVMPGVTVEAASPALIEKVRSVVTDGQGLYRVVDLRPGTYSVTFTLPGFSTFRRDGIELAAGFAATVNAEMKVGALEETVTVSGAAPVVDTQNIRQQTNVSRGTLEAVPGSGRLSVMSTILPGAVQSPETQSVGGVTERAQTAFSIHGAPTAAPVQDGMNQAVGGGGAGSFYFNSITFQEVVLETSGMSAERNTGGIAINIVPKDGGNTFSGSFTIAATGPRLESGNLTDALRARGLQPTPSLRKFYDVAGAWGGPIMRDRLWFYNAYRSHDSQQYQQGNYFNKLHGLQGGLFYEPDLSRPAHTDDYDRDYNLRLTWQAAQKHKIAVANSIQPNCNCFQFLLAPQEGILAAPEATGEHHYDPNALPVATWTYTATNRLLVEAGVSANFFTNQSKRVAGVGDDLIQVVELSQNLRYNSRATAINNVGGSYTTVVRRQYHQRFAVSYITGSHAFKTGLDLNQYNLGRAKNYQNPNQINQARNYTFRNRVPQTVRIWATPFGLRDSSRDIAAFAQDQWTVKRLTLNLGVRFNDYKASVPPQELPAGLWVPARSFPALENVPHWTNLSPRLGVAYDLFGTGKTALKASLGWYTPNSMGATSNPAGDQAPSTTRNWTDTNGNYITDCDLLNPNVQDNRASGGDLCGVWSDLTFGRPKASNTRRATDAQEGFNRESWNRQGSVSIQQQLRPNVALNVGYFRTWYGGFLATDNQFVTPADYDPYCITAPVDSRLPNSGQQLCGLYDLRPALFGRTDNLVTQASHYGTQTRVFNGVDVTVAARFGKGGQVSGGLSLGRTVTNNCFVVDSPQQARPGFCDNTPPWSSSTQIKLLAVYPLPWNFQASAIYQNIPGVPITASYVATNAQVLPTLGHNLGSCRGAATCNGTVTIDLIPNNTLFEPRLQQVDLRFTRIFRIGKVTARGNLDVSNLFNVSNVLNENTRYGPQWLNAVQILGGRLFKVSGQLDF